jgi:hypothetical protein
MERLQTFILNQDRYNELAAKVPAGGLLFNATRDLLGDETWFGDFCHGIFYAVVRQDNPDRARYIKYNQEMDAWLLRFVTVAEAKQMVRDRLATMHVEVDADLFEQAWEDSFYATISVRNIMPEDIAP